MAWYVESLILDRARIKQQVTHGNVSVDTTVDGDLSEFLFLHNREPENVDGYNDVSFMLYVDVDFEDVFFNDLLQVEKAVQVLMEKGEIDLIDIKVLNVLSSGDSLVSMSQREQIDVNMLIKRFFTTCNKISYELQGHFTDMGYINYMTEKHSLNPKQIKKMVRYLQKSRRTRIRRLINDKATY
jgi:hypothetical protein